MSKAAVVPLSAGLLTVKKGEAVPLAIGTRSEPQQPARPAEPPPTVVDAVAEAQKPAAAARPKPQPPADEPLVHHNFKVKKSFKRAFDQAAFDADMKHVEFLQHVFAFYQKHHKSERS